MFANNNMQMVDKDVWCNCMFTGDLIENSGSAQS